MSPRRSGRCPAATLRLWVQVMLPINKLKKKGILVDGDLMEKFVLFKRENDELKMVKIILNRMYLDINSHCSKYYHIKLIERISRLGRVVRHTYWRKY